MGTDLYIYICHGFIQFTIPKRVSCYLMQANQLPLDGPIDFKDIIADLMVFYPPHTLF